MDYIGSKEKINNWMFSIILDGINPKNETFLDACVGSASVSRYAAKSGFGKIICNDIMEFPSHLARGSISLPQFKLAEALSLIEQMNKLSGVKGFFYQNYSENSNRLFFSDHNAKQIDACRQFVETIIDPDLKSYLFYCLIEALSGVSNCTGVHAAFLKQYKTRAIKEMIVKVKPSLHLEGIIQTYNQDILSLLQSKSIKESILYLDPPYNQRQYGSNYHLYETLIKYDDPILTGKVGLRNWKDTKSTFCSKKECGSFTKQIVDHTTAHTIYISYNSDGHLSKNDFINLFDEYNIKFFSKIQKRYRADSNINRKFNKNKLLEYLFKITK